ncbi:MAG: hypothetical protein G01um101493_98 [Microgenomates group bacterium Gr01-1014_93]|nr:MAG: hypothetical protein G01um101493_98 [Microgenomates group bacterium Gr01-1014_93]
MKIHSKINYDKYLSPQCRGEVKLPERAASRRVVATCECFTSTLGIFILSKI